MVRCYKCNARLTLPAAGGRMQPCPGCGRLLQIAAFPAMARPLPTGQSGEAIVSTGVAGCFYHPDKKAVTPCAVCGRFLCALCDIPIDDRHLCPACLDSSRRTNGIATIENRRLLYDDLALSLAVYPSLLIYPTIVTAPLTVILVIRHWKAPLSLIPRTRWRFVLALGVAGLQIAGWATVAAMAFLP